MQGFLLEETLSLATQGVCGLHHMRCNILKAQLFKRGRSATRLGVLVGGWVRSLARSRTGSDPETHEEEVKWGRGAGAAEGCCLGPPARYFIFWGRVPY